MSRKKDEPLHLGMQFEKFPNRYYQRRRNRRSSGPAEWHCRTPKMRKLQQAISASVGVIIEGQHGDLAVRIASVLNDGK